MVFVAAAAFASGGAGGRRRGAMFASAAIAGAVLAQFLVLNGHRVSGAYLYGASIAVALAGLFTTGPAARGDWRAWALTLRQEIAFAGIIFAGLIGLRLWRLGDYPRGIEQDEAAWMWMHGQIFYGYLPPDSITSANYAQLPMGFHERQLMLDALGQTFLSSRIDVMLSSLLALVLVYLLVRLLTSPAIALITIILVGTSILDLASSRLAETESQTKMWVALSYLTLILAIKRQSLRLGVASGGAMAMGMVTYLIFHMTPIVAAVTLIFYFLRDSPVPAWRFVRDRTVERIRELRISGGIYIGLAVATALPLLLVRGRMVKLVDRQRGFNSASWVAWTTTHPYEGSFEKLKEMFSFAGHNFHLIIEELFWVQRFSDFFIVRPGHPIVIAGILPFFVVGLAVVAKNWRKGFNAFILLWLFIQFFLAATATGAVQARVLLPGLPAFSLIAALGIYHVFTQLAPRGASAASRWAPFVLASGAAISIGAVSVYAYFNDLTDPPSGLERREMVDYVREAAQESRLAIFPYAEGVAERLRSEGTGVRFTVGSVTGQDHALERMAIVPYDALLAAVSGGYEEGVAVVWQHTITGEYDPRASAIAALKKCYPEHRTETGDYYELIVIDAQASRECYSASRDEVKLGTIAEPGRYVLSFTAPPAAGQYRLVLEHLPPNLIRLEAEQAFSAPRWYTDLRFGAGFTGPGFLIDVLGAGVAKANVNIASGGDYSIWVRLYSRAKTDASAFFLVDGVETTVEEGDFDRWAWRRVGRFKLDAGSHEIGFGRHYGSDPLGIFFDAVILAADDSVDPNEREWRTVYDSGQRPMAAAHTITAADGICDATCAPGGVLPAGEYRWRVQLFDGDKLVGEDGSIGLFSDYSFFTVTD